MRLRDYAEQSRRPWTAVLMLTPLMIGYELMMRWLGRSMPSTGPADLVAFDLMGQTFARFGATLPYLPTAAVVVTLFTIHLARGDRWSVRPTVMVGTVFEAVVWAAVLLAMGVGFGWAWQRLPLNAAFAVDDAQLRLFTLSVGAGVFEEWLFRLLGLAAVHFLLVDLSRLPRWLGTALAVLVCALAFSAYHLLGSEQFHPQVFVFRTVAGCFFGGLMLWRGITVTALTHASYNIAVVAASGWA